jgi:GNAT superfamily N-acetyltransferase
MPVNLHQQRGEDRIVDRSRTWAIQTLQRTATINLFSASHPQAASACGPPTSGPQREKVPDYQERGIGTRLMEMLLTRYVGFHMHMLVADGRALDFYQKCGFRRAGKTESMWIYAGDDH